MSPTELVPLHFGAVAIDLVGAAIIVGYAGAALLALARTGSLTRAQLFVAEGAVFGLSFKVAGTLLKTLEIHTWDQILLFSTILALRTLLKSLFNWERGRLRRALDDAADARVLDADASDAGGATSRR